MSAQLGFFLELIVAGLLLVTIGYCMMLDRRLRRLRQDEAVMKKNVAELSLATERAERAVEALRQTLGECDRTLADRLRVAERYAADLEGQIKSGDDVLNRISKIVTSTRAAVEDAVMGSALAQGAPPQRTAASTLAAAEAFAARSRSRDGSRDSAA